MQIPTIWIVNTIGVRVWYSITLFAWGLVSVATAFVRNGVDLIALRFLLGLAEGGVSVMTYIYLEAFLLPDDLTAAWGIAFLAAQQAASIIAGPSAALMLAYLQVGPIDDSLTKWEIERVRDRTGNRRGTGGVERSWTNGGGREIWLDRAQKACVQERTGRGKRRGLHTHPAWQPITTAATYRASLGWRAISGCTSSWGYWPLLWEYACSSSSFLPRPRQQFGRKRSVQQCSL